MKKRISMALAMATAATMATVSVPAMAADDVNITIFNSKMEVQSQFEEKAAEYSEETGVGVEVYSSSSPGYQIFCKRPIHTGHGRCERYLLPRERSRDRLK